MNLVSEAQVQQELVQTTEAHALLRQRAIRRVVTALGLVIALAIFFLWLPASSRSFLLNKLVANRLLVSLLLIFGLVAISLLWSVGQRLDVWMFKALNLRGYHSLWMDRAMWTATQIGNFGFATVLVVGAYVSVIP